MNEIKKEIQSDCKICENASQYVWRVGELETNVKWLNKLLIGTLTSSIATLAGVIAILVTK